MNCSATLAGRYQHETEVDRGGKHHDPVNGPPGAWVHGLEEVSRTVRGEELMREAQTPTKISRAGATPICGRPSRHKPASLVPSLRGSLPPLGEVKSLCSPHREARCKPEF
jgi:hypothetical protein